MNYPQQMPDAASQRVSVFSCRPVSGGWVKVIKFGAGASRLPAVPGAQASPCELKGRGGGRESLAAGLSPSGAGGSSWRVLPSSQVPPAKNKSGNCLSPPSKHITAGFPDKPCLPHSRLDAVWIMKLDIISGSCSSEMTCLRSRRDWNTVL